MANQLASLLLSVSDFIEPLTEALKSPEALESLFYRSGLRVQLDDAAFARLKDVLRFVSASQRVVELAGPLRDRLIADPNATPGLAELAELGDAVATLLQAVAVFEPDSLDGLPPPLDDGAAWTRTAEYLFDALLERYLRIYHPVVYLVLLCIGCIRYNRHLADGPADVPIVAASFDWEQLQSMLDDPVAALKQAYAWNDPQVPFDHQRLLDSLGRALRAMRISIDVLAPSVQLEPGLPEDAAAQVVPDVDALRATILHSVVLSTGATYEVGFDLLPAATTAGGLASGLILRPRLIGGAEQTLAVGDAAMLRWKVAADVGDVIGLRFFPGDTSLIGGEAVLGAAVEVAGSRTESWYVLGNPRSSRIEVANPSLRLSFEGSPDDPELRLRLAANGPAGQPGCALVLQFDEADSFVRETVSDQPLRIDFAADVTWSSRTGLAFSGRATPSLEFPLSLRLGPIVLRNVKLGLTSGPARTSQPSFMLRVGLDASTSIGPVDVVVQDVGFACELIPYRRQDIVDLPPGADGPVLGNLGIDLQFAPPTGVGLSVDAEGVVTGGGFLFHDEQQHLYAGVMQLSLHETLTLKAFGLIGTQMPDGSQGYSVLVFVTAEDFKPVPLGMGFSLLAIGGLLGIHRTFDDDAMRANLKNDTLGTLLFPRDPVHNAPAIIRSLAPVFPARRGSYLLGLLARIGRTSPPIVMDLAVIYEFGVRHRLIVLGRITSLMPSPDEDLVRIKVEAVGVIDLDEGSVAIDAVLVDSRLAHKYALSGAMALRARWTNGPGASFALAVGGFNPHFTPPPGMPALERMTIALASGTNPRLTCEAYLAITSNTLQFGARAQLYAAAYSFSIEGDVGFDVLVQFAPFHFVADFHASVQLKRGPHKLFKVAVQGELEGPRPLRVSGKASFEILWCDFTVRFDKTLIQGEPPPLPPAVDVLQELRRALSNQGSWSTRVAGQRQSGVTLGQPPSGARLTIDPLGSVAVRQQVVPLNTSRDVDVFGSAPVSGARRFELGATLNGQRQTGIPIQDQFAPAQFFSMSDDEKLASPSFESMQSGVMFGATTATFDERDIVPAPLEYDTLIVDAEFSLAPNAAPAYTMDAESLQRVSQFGAVATAPIRNTGREKFRDPSAQPAATLSAPRWKLVSLMDQSVSAPVDSSTATWTESRALLRTLTRSGGEWQLVRADEVLRNT